MTWCLVPPCNGTWLPDKLMIQTTTAQVTQLWGTLRRLLKKPTVLFTANRYLSYLLQLVRGIWLARILGPILFGVWGFLMLVSQYMSYTGLGLQYAINVELAVAESDNKQNHARLIAVALTTTGLISVGLLLAGLIVQYFQIPLFNKYSFTQYALVMALLTGLTHLNQVYANIYRVYQKLGRIAAYELILAALPLAIIFFVSREQLIMASLVAMVLANVIGVLVYTVRAPFPVRLMWDTPIARHLLKIGVPLLVYNLSFWLIILAGRTIIGISYSVEMMGYFSLAYALANATLLGLRAVAWIIFPVVLAKTRFGLPDEAVRQTVWRVNMVYGTAVFLVVFGMILAAPLLVIILPQYAASVGVLILLLLSQAVLSVTFGYNSVAIARKQQMKVAGIAMLAVVVVLIFGFAAAWLNLSMLWVAMSILAGSAVFTFLQAWLGEGMLQQRPRIQDYWGRVMPIGSVIAVVLAVIGCLTEQYLVFSLAGLVVFLTGNRPQLRALWQYARSL